MKTAAFISLVFCVACVYAPDASAHKIYTGLFDLENPQKSEIQYTIQPIVGYEVQRKENPTRTQLVFVYGARVTAGYKILALEGEYTHGTSNETLPASSQNIRETTDRFRLGLRSSYDLMSILTATLRGGAETMNRKTETTTSGVTTTTESPSKVDPYAGLGVSIHVADMISISGDVTVTFRDFGDMKKNDVSSTLGVSIHLNN